MKKRYSINKVKIILIYFLLVIVSLTITIVYVALNQDSQRKIIIFAYFFMFIAVITIMYLNPKLSSSLGGFLNLRIEIDDNNISWINRDNIKVYEWIDVDEVLCHCPLLSPGCYITIWYKDRIDEPIEIPVFMKNSKQLYKEIYENVKEKSPNAKIDRRFIKYVEEKC